MKRPGLKYNKGNLRSWIAKMSNLFSVEEFMMVDNAIKWEYNDLYPLDTQYDKYAGGRSGTREILFNF